MTRAKNKTKVGLLKRWILWINYSFILLLLLTYLTPLIRVESWGWLSLLALAYPFVLFANGLFALGWIFFRSWYAIGSMLIILAGFNYHLMYVKLFSSVPNQDQCEESIRLMTYNMRGLSMVPVKKGMGIEAKIDSLYQAINGLAEFPDILCLQEAAKGDLIAKRFRMGYSLHAPKSSLWILSRYPILKHGEIEGQENSPSCMWADIKTPQGMLRIYNMHLVSNRVTNTTEELLQSTGLPKEKAWSNVRFIVNRYKRTTRKRAIEAKLLRDHLEKCPYPAVVAGDGNDTPLSHTFHVLSSGLKDSFIESGSGISTTYKSTLPLLRIDYILGTQQIHFKNLNTHRLTYSDHYPVSSGICILPASGS